MGIKPPFRPGIWQRHVQDFRCLMQKIQFMQKIQCSECINMPRCHTSRSPSSLLTLPALVVLRNVDESEITRCHRVGVALHRNMDSS